MDPNVPKMHAEAGFEADDAAPPLRVSGFLCLIFGLLSIASPMGRPLLVFPALALFFGVIALRRYQGPPPAGRKPAMVGLVLAAGFGMCGVMLPFLKTLTLAQQAERFSRYYIELIAMEQDEFAMELNKTYVNRFPETMSLKEHYHASDQALQAFEEFRDNLAYQMIRRRGPNSEWVLDRPIRIYYSYDREHAEIVWQDPSGRSETKILMILDYLLDREGQGQWHVSTAVPLTEQFVAESVL